MQLGYGLHKGTYAVAKRTGGSSFWASLWGGVKTFFQSRRGRKALPARPRVAPKEGTRKEQEKWRGEGRSAGYSLRMLIKITDWLSFNKKAGGRKISPLKNTAETDSTREDPIAEGADHCPGEMSKDGKRQLTHGKRGGQLKCVAIWKKKYAIKTSGRRSSRGEKKGGGELSRRNKKS